MRPIALTLLALCLTSCVSLGGSKVDEVVVEFTDGNVITVRPDSLDDLGIASVLVRFNDGVTARWAPLQPREPAPMPEGMPEVEAPPVAPVE